MKTLLLSLSLLCALLPAASLQAQSPAPAYTVQFDHPNLIVADVQAQAAWYHRFLGFQLPEAASQPQGAKPTRMRLTLPGLSLFLVQYSGAQPPRPPARATEQLGVGYLAFSVSDLDAARKLVQEAGIPMEITHNPQGQPVGFLFRDPEGNQIELFGRKRD